MNWFKTAHCRSGAHCAPCRHSPEFRVIIMQSGQADAPDWECPFAMDPPSPHEGPGTRLMRLLRRLGFNHSPRCACQDMALKMNLRGSDWCRENVDEILRVMRESAADPGSNPMRVPFVECVARRIVLHCVR